ncbi:hypothetical protein L1887_11180 [Cichorium endivia]|nr:hypothetical protein L1887_11180 [Cichorium endivia]
MTPPVTTGEKLAERYLGSNKPKKRVIKPSEKFRFSFDWENTEDISRFRASMDRREQKKLAAKNQKELRDEIRKKDGIEERLEEAASVFCLLYCPCIL